MSWSRKVRVVEEVEELSADCEFSRFQVRKRQLETLLDREVGVRVRRPVDLIAPLLTEAGWIDVVTRDSNTARVSSCTRGVVEHSAAATALHPIDLPGKKRDRT